MNEKMTKILNVFSENLQCRLLQFIVKKYRRAARVSCYEITLDFSFQIINATQMFDIYFFSLGELIN